MSSPQPASVARADFFSLARWGYFLAAGVLAAFAAALAYRNTAFQSYSELIVGGIAWAYETKSNDYALLYALVACFFLSLWLLSVLAARVERAWPASEPALHDFVLLLCVPAGMWVAGLFATREDSLALLTFSGGLLLAGAGFTAILARREDGSFRATPPFGVVHKLLVFVVLSVFAFASVALGIDRLGAAFGSSFWLDARAVRLGCVAIGLAGLAAAVAAAVAVPTRPALERLLDRGIVALQFALPASFLLLLPNPWVAEGRLLIGYPVTGWIWVAVAVCMAGAYADLARHALRLRAAPQRSAVSLLATSSLVAVLFFLKTRPGGVPSLWPDDYHFGELLVPWWSLVEHHLVPFWEYAPARGLVNYVYGAVLSIFFDGQVASYGAVGGFFYLGLLFLALPVLARVLGRGIAFLALFLFPYLNGFNEIDLVVTVFLCVMCAGFGRWRPAAWLALWVALGTGLVLFAPGQGAFAVIATSPLGLLLLYRMKQGQRDGWKILAAVLAALVVLALLTPLGKMVFGAVRYGYEQSAVNSVAHGMWWSAGFDKAPVNPWLFDIVRSLWLLAAVWAGVLIWKTLREQDRTRRTRVLVWAVPVLIISILFIVRAAGRIDPDGSMSRLGSASIWALALLLPILMFAAAGVRQIGAAVFVWASVASLVHVTGSGVAELVHHFEPVPDPRRSSQWVAQIDALPLAGAGLLLPDHTGRLVALRKVLDTVLSPDETYLDLSGRHATYYYLQRRPPVEAGSIYNLVTAKQQLRGIAALRENPPPLVLISADNVLHDGGPASLRSHLVYRYLLLSNRYKVARIGATVWLVEDSRLGRLAGLDVRGISEVSDAPDSPLHAVFAWNDLANIPASWGRSAGSLERQLLAIATVPTRNHAGMHALEPSPSGDFRVTGPDPSVRYDLGRLKLAGSDAGILGFDFHCSRRAGGPPPVLEIFWATGSNPESELTVTRLAGRQGRLLVPLDAYPAWLLARQVKSLRFDVADAASCSSYRVSNLTLYQRAAAEQLRPAVLRAGFAGRGG